MTRTLVSCLLWLACGASLGALPADMEPPKVTLAGLRIVEMNLQQQTLALKLRVQNPNLFDIPLHSFTYQVELNGERIVRGRREDPITLPGGGEQIVEMQAVTSLQEVLDQLRAMAESGKPVVTYRVYGEFRIGNGTTPIPFDQRSRFDLRELFGVPKEPSPSERYI